MLYIKYSIIIYLFVFRLSYYYFILLLSLHIIIIIIIIIRLTPERATQDIRAQSLRVSPYLWRAGVWCGRWSDVDIHVRSTARHV